LYSVIISSDAPCPINQTAQFEIFEPLELTGTYNLIDVNGTNSTLGDSIAIQITGGTPGYSVTWNTPNGTIFNESTIEVGLNGEYTYTITDLNDCTFSESILLAGIQEQSYSARFLIYPNPVNETNAIQVRGETQINQIDVVDSKGAIIYNTSPRQNSAVLETFNWSNGLYSIRIHTSNEVISYRIIKQ
jgi:hypothetical protein